MTPEKFAAKIAEALFRYGNHKITAEYALEEIALAVATYNHRKNRRNTR